jgi:membrane protease YdiL (CAAX protease family)
MYPVAALLATSQVDTVDPQVPPSVSHPMNMLLVVGSLVLVVWVIRRILNPEKLRLGEAPRRENSLNPGHVVLVFLIWNLLGAAVQTYPPFDLGETQAKILAALIAQSVGIVLALIVAKMCFRPGLRRGLGLSGRHWGFDSLRGVLAYLAVLPVTTGLIFLMVWLLPEGWQRPHSMLKALHETSTGWTLAITFSAVVLAALLEEIVFRGLLQSMMRRVVSPWATVLISSGIFAVVHSELQNVPALFALGVVLGYSYERTGRLWAPILTHAIFNGVAIGMALWQGTGG